MIFTTREINYPSAATASSASTSSTSAAATASAATHSSHHFLADCLLDVDVTTSEFVITLGKQ